MKIGTGKENALSSFVINADISGLAQVIKQTVLVVLAIIIIRSPLETVHSLVWNGLKRISVNILRSC